MNYINTQQTPHTTPQNGVLSEQHHLELALNKFYKFLNNLESRGMPREMVNKAINNLEYFIEIGYEPTMGDLFGLQNPRGLSAPTQEDLVVAGTVAAGGDVETGKFIASLLPSDFFNNTFGAVFANGFNLSCWNSTFTPSEVTEEVSRIHVPFFTSVLENASNSTGTEELEAYFNYLLKAVDISYKMYAEYLVNGANWRSCSQEAIQIYVDIVSGAKQQTDTLLDNLMKKYNITITTKSVPAAFTYPSELTGQPEDFSWSEAQHGNATYRIIKFNERIEDSLSRNQQQAGFGLISMLVLAGIGFGLYRSSQNTPNTTPQTPHTK